MEARLDGGRDTTNDYLFDACGYLRHRSHLDAARVAQLLEALAPRWETTTSVGTERVRSLVGVSDRFVDLANHLARDMQVQRYINQPYRLIESYGLRRIAGTSLPLHNGFSQRQVSVTGDSSSRSMWRHHTYHDGKTYCMMVKILLYLTDVATEGDGPFCFVEGSHKANFALPIPGPEVNASLAQQVLPNVRALPVLAGDVVVLNEALMHGTLIKTTSAPRVVLAFSYAPRFVADYDETSGPALPAGSGTGFYP